MKNKKLFGILAIVLLILVGSYFTFFNKSTSLQEQIQEYKHDYKIKEDIESVTIMDLVDNKIMETDDTKFIDELREENITFKKLKNMNNVDGDWYNVSIYYKGHTVPLELRVYKNFILTVDQPAIYEVTGKNFIYDFIQSNTSKWENVFK